MKINKKKLIIIGISILPFIILVIIDILRDFSWTPEVLTGIRYFLIILLFIPTLLYIMIMIGDKLKKTDRLKNFSDLILFYYALIFFIISFNIDIVPIPAKWNISMTGLGVSVFALALALYKKGGNTSSIEKTEKIEEHSKVLDETQKTINKFEAKIHAQNKALDSTQSVINTFKNRIERSNENFEKIERNLEIIIEKTQKLDNILSKIQIKDNS